MDTRYKRANFAFGPHSLAVEHFADPEREFSAHFMGEEEAAHPEPPFYGFLWPAAEALAIHLWERHQLGQLPQQILELGCGLGLPSLVCALAGSRITALDHHPEAGPLLAKNFVLNALDPPQHAVGSFTDEKLDLGLFPMLIGSDILYDPVQHKPLKAFVTRHLLPRGHLLITDPGRYPSEAFLSLMEADFTYEKLILKLPQREQSIDLHHFQARQ